MEAKQIILVGSNLLSEILQRVFNKIDDMEVLGNIRNFSSLPEIIDRKQPDWVIFSQLTGDKLHDDIDMLIRDYPDLNVLTIKLNTGVISIEWLGQQEKIIKATTVEELTEALRSRPVIKTNASQK